MNPDTLEVSYKMFRSVLDNKVFDVYRFVKDQKKPNLFARGLSFADASVMIYALNGLDDSESASEVNPSTPI